jgi:hypothetical protein
MRVWTVALAIQMGNCFHVRKAILKNSQVFAGAVRTLNVSVRTGTVWTILMAIWIINLQHFC